MTASLPDLVESLSLDSLDALIDDLGRVDTTQATPLGWFHAALAAAARREYAARTADLPLDLTVYAA